MIKATRLHPMVIISRLWIGQAFFLFKASVKRVEVMFTRISPRRKSISRKLFSCRVRPVIKTVFNTIVTKMDMIIK